MAALVFAQALQHIQQVVGCPCRRKQLARGYTGLKGPGQLRCRCAWVQQAHATQGEPALPFDGQGTEQLVLGGLAGPVAVPAPQAVVADAADAGLETGEMEGLIPR